MRNYNNIEHFKVPEKYFETLTDNIMNALPEQPAQQMTLRKKTHTVVLRRLAYAAAMAVLVASAALVYFHYNAEMHETEIASSETTTKTTASDIEMAAEYMLVDRQEVYRMIVED